ncbi:hypothetical protein Dsin_023706 [Dipteronia sinensis]|uniref:Disease resistance R13L4/SHOC-2-like LRR domain-containing protein n=1 Tax=Dipteronia sinensis TaxID=43782 RepID=A0AAE0E154_9ROSI|nr:hypothetical protein Dsin_023706 [Dipteronia sinensis]
MASSTNPSVKSNSGQVLEAEETTDSISTVAHGNTAKNGYRRGTKNKNGRSRNQKKKVLCNPLQGVKFMVSIRNTSKKKDSTAPQSHHDVPVLLETEEAITRACSTDSDAYKSSIFRDFRAIIEGLDLQRKNCLLTFAVFPENIVVKKRLLVYWWIGEGLLDPPPNTSIITGEMTVEKIATEILQDFMAKRFIIPVNTKRKTVVNRFKMDPNLRSLVILLAREGKFFDYDSSGELTCKYSGSEKACLINTEKLESENQDKIKTLFNVNQRFLDFTFDWFSKMKNVRVLCLGMWWSSGESHHHIEVKNTEFLKGLKSMESLRLLSFHGISGIQGLPGSISKLRNLRILDLKACYNLESLPKEIKSLKMLTHLDISECYLLDHMPKELASLFDLQVLKGFVITDIISHGNCCSLADLSGLKKLRKLSINVNSETFPIEELLTTLSKFEELEKLKIAWGGGSKAKESTGAGKKMVRQKCLFEKVVKKQKSKVDGAKEIKKLQKLDLQCFPQKTLPDWLIPENVKKLKKLCIRGGGLNSLSKKMQEGEIIKWDVEVLHLKYLSELKINWSELKAMFPKLSYLEKFKCPKVTFCPCDGSGIWLESSTN